MRGLVLSEAARNDRRQITAYTVLHFGVHQARRLRDQFHAALAALVDSPLLGRTNEDLDPEGRSFRYFVVSRVFVVVYEPRSQGIRVARLLHGARNLAAELDRDAGED